MIYFILFVVFVIFFFYSYNSKKDNKLLAYFMGFLLFVLVALRDKTVGPDTATYVDFFLNIGFRSVDMRDVEGLFLKWMDFWRFFDISGQLYLIICAIASVGLVLFAIWKSSKQRVWSYTLFLVAFSWYFYLSGIRQSMAMGCFAFGTCLLTRNKSYLGTIRLKNYINRNNIIAIVFLVLAPLFHTTALFADVLLLLAIALPKKGRSVYIWAISISFIICLTAVFKDAELLMHDVFGFVSSEIDIALRYEGYIESDYLYDTSFYMLLKSALPLNFIGLFALVIGKREYDIHEKLFFLLIIFSNLFFYFPFMFRMKMYFYPMACIAISNMTWPVLKSAKFNLNYVLMSLYIVLNAYINCVNLVVQKPFTYHLCF